MSDENLIKDYQRFRELVADEVEWAKKYFRPKRIRKDEFFDFVHYYDSFQLFCEVFSDAERRRRLIDRYESRASQIDWWIEHTDLIRAVPEELFWN